MDTHHTNYYLYDRNETDMKKRILKWSTLLWPLEQL
jgi:hypothetical protein